jgi:uncharacterized protein YkwD
MPVRRLLLVLFLLLAGVVAAPVTAGAGPRTDAEFVRLINNTRADQGLPPLQVSPRLTALARSHAHAMAANDCQASRGCLWHTDLSDSVGTWAWLGQNVGVGQSPRSLHHKFVRSRQGHRENTLSRRANLIGVGTNWVHDGRVWVVVNFMQSA